MLKEEQIIIHSINLQLKLCEGTQRGHFENMALKLSWIQDTYLYVEV